MFAAILCLATLPYQLQLDLTPQGWTTEKMVEVIRLCTNIPDRLTHTILPRLARELTVLAQHEHGFTPLGWCMLHNDTIGFTLWTDFCNPICDAPPELVWGLDEGTDE